MGVLILAPAETTHLTAPLPDEGPEQCREDAKEEDQKAIERLEGQPLQSSEHGAEEDGQGDIAQGREAGEVVPLDELGCDVACMVHPERRWEEGGHKVYGGMQ